jgi:phosphotriesterase-related protein
MTMALTRRQALGLLGAGAAAAALPRAVSAQSPSFPPGAIIRTLFRDYKPDELAGGATLFHEHLQMGRDFNARFIAATNATRVANGQPPLPPGRGGGPPSPPLDQDPTHNVDLMVDLLKQTMRDGVACLVDAGHPEMGRDMSFVREVSMKSGLPVVEGGGFYTQPFYPKAISTMSEQQVFEALMKQVETDPIGVWGEIGSWDDMTADERKVFRAVGKAHLATNMSIFTHTGIPGKAAIEQLDILEDAGVPPNRIVIGHLGNLPDPNLTVQKTICRRGAFIGIDRQGGPGDDRAVPMVKALVDAGFADHLMFSGDASRAYGRTITAFLPKLRAAGIPDDVLHRIVVDNPRRFLAFVPKKPRPKK